MGFILATCISSNFTEKRSMELLAVRMCIILPVDVVSLQGIYTAREVVGAGEMYICTATVPWLRCLAP